ncbi:MAG: 4Fe-4S dicluster domain-containing protein [Dehalococcoidales bacterium]|nr:4Fe-4S dicluster domain-containing protein [Dehalococcoidales bacterium]
MANKKVNKKDIAKLLNQWRQQFTVLAPSKENGVAQMAEWDGKDTSFLDWYRNTVIPPKASFLPPMEEMFRFQKDKEGYHIELPPTNEHKQLIFGIRPCDARAMTILDMTFEEAYQDPYYLSRRKNAVLVGLGCTNPCESCFCTSMGVSPTESTNVDLMLTDIGDQFLIEVVTDKGKELIAKASGLKEATKDDEAKAKETKETSYNKITRKLDTEGIVDKLQASFDDEGFWEQTAAKCISCGICTLLCPTCYCFDINDELVRGEGTRFRSWDSCGFPVYTKMPMENPRLEKWRRVRQKVCHKFEFYPMTFNVIACTGCGRCIRLCPVNWDITQVLESVPVKTGVRK